MESNGLKCSMKIFVNAKIKALFYKILLCIVVFAMIAAVLIITVQNAAMYLFACAMGMVIAILCICYGYFREQHRMIEKAAAQITAYMDGDKDARIQCDDEGELNRLFHEINALVAILNAHGEKELRAKEFLRNTIADISHQLKTPLAALNIYNGILQEEAEHSPTLQKFTALSERELERIETLVQSLLKIAKLDAGTIVMEKTEENMAEMMDSIEKQFAFRAAQEGKQLVISGDKSTRLLCDPSWLLEAIGNIVKNAFDHTQAGNHIIIAWKQFASVVQIVIQDDGSGIHPEDLHHIFKRFYRSRFSQNTQGVGLGLPLAKGIIQAHSGTLEVDSQLGVGTTFTINLLIPTKL